MRHNPKSRQEGKEQIQAELAQIDEYLFSEARELAYWEEYEDDDFDPLFSDMSDYQEDLLDDWWWAREDKVFA